MNTYDFDKTIYIRDSSCDFFLYCLGKYPAAILRIFPRLIRKSCLYLLKKCSFTELKESAFSFLRYLPDANHAAEAFWRQKWKGIGSWYLAQKMPDDVIISASPAFLLRPVGESLGVEIIATDMDSTSGKINGKNCHDTEKVRRFYEKHPDGCTENFYSDSKADEPMAKIAFRAFRVKRGKLSPWEETN